MKRALLLASLSSFALAACSSGVDSVSSSSAAGSGASDAVSSSGSGDPTSTGAGAGSSTSGSGGGGFDPGGDLTTFDSEAGPIQVKPGDEATQCMTLRLGNVDGAFVRRFRAELSEGSHHLIVYKSKATEEAPNPVNCSGFSGLFSGEYPIFIAQQAAAELVFPVDTETGLPVGFEIQPDQMLRFEFHFINTTPQPIDVTGKVHFDTIPLSSDVLKSDLAFWGTTNINIPPNGSFDTGVKFQKGLSDTKTFALTTHQHQHGTRMRVWHSNDKNDTGSEPVADGTDWANPPLEMFDPPLAFPAGSGSSSTKGFAYQCEYQNTSSSQVGFGEGFNDEMCFLWHYYYPSAGFQYCVDGLCQKSPSP